MATPPPIATPDSRTRIAFDLRDELTAEEIKHFEEAAESAGAESLTDHFLNLAVRLPAQSSKP